MDPHEVVPRVASASREIAVDSAREFSSSLPTLRYNLSGMETTIWPTLTAANGSAPSVTSSS